MKKAVSAIILSMILFVGTTCKKISGYPENMYGIWWCEHECVSIELVIKKNSRGDYGSGCDKLHTKGRVRYTEEALYIGTAKFKFIVKPEKIDSTLPFLVHNSTKISAKMRIHEPQLRGGNSYTLYKIIDY